MRRALLIGSQTGELRGVHNDVRLVATTLSEIGFTTTPITGADATADGIVGHYRRLISASAPGDAVVVYYSGHGGRSLNPLADRDPALPRWLRYIVPTDVTDRSGGRVRCVLAEELSRLQHELTSRTENVTTIMDCCYSAGLSRAADGLVPKSAGGLPITDDLVERWRALHPRPQEADANPHAVRIVAAAADQLAYEHDDAELGPHGLLTVAFVRWLTGADTIGATWRDAAEFLRDSVRRVERGQRPGVEGPVERLPFSVEVGHAARALPVRRDGGLCWLADAPLLGIGVGDVYALVERGGDPAAPSTIASVEQIAGGRAVLRPRDPVPVDGGVPLHALPLHCAREPWPVAVHGGPGPVREAVLDVLQRSLRLRPTQRHAGVLATVVIDADADADAVQVLDLARLPLYTVPLRGGRAAATAVADVERLAAAEDVRALPSGVGTAALPNDVTVAFLLVGQDGRGVPLQSGAQLHVDDLLIVRLEALAHGRFGAVFDIGVAGAVTQLTRQEQDGVALTPGVPYELGRDWPAGGIRLSWPAGIPDTAPRRESFQVILTDRQVAGLHRLGQQGVTRGDAPSLLDRLLRNASTGRRDAGPPAAGGLRHRVEQLDFRLAPSTRPDPPRTAPREWLR